MNVCVINEHGGKSDRQHSKIRAFRNYEYTFLPLIRTSNAEASEKTNS